MKVIGFVCSILFISIPGVSQWKKMHPSSPINRHLHYSFITGNTWIGVGNDIVYSNDDGETWALTPNVKLPVTLKGGQRYDDVFFVDQHTGFLASKESIFKTIDGGVSWTTVLTLSPSNPQHIASAYFHSIFFINALAGYAVGDFEKLFKTVDGGTTWTEVSWTGNTQPYISFTDVYFLNEQVGFISGYEVSDLWMNFGFDEFVMKTTDAGKHWTRISLPTNADFREVAVTFLDHQHGFVHATTTQTSDQLFKTTDGGATWEGCSPSNLRSMHMVKWFSDKLGFISGVTHNGEYTLQRTNNSGDGWMTIDPPVFTQQNEFAIMDMRFDDDLFNGFSVGAGGNILRTQDGGMSWSAANVAFPVFHTFDFVDEHVGYASSSIGFFKSVDSGATWNFMEKSDSLVINSISFDDTGRGYFHGWRNFFYDVDQGGKTIRSITLPNYLISLSGFNSKGDSVFVAGGTIGPSGNVLMISGDRGNSWKTVVLPSTSSFVASIERKDNTLYYMLSSSITSTTMEGENWTTVAEFTDDYLHATVILDNGAMLSSFSSGKVKRSMSGTEWADVGPFSTDTQVFGFVHHGSVVFAFGQQFDGNDPFGAVWRSNDYGNHWVKESLPLVDGVINDMDIEGDIAFATGGNGLVFTLDLNGEVTSGGQSENLTPVIYPIPAKNSLYVEWPNREIHNVVLLSVTGMRYPLPVSKRSHNLWEMDLTSIAPGIYIFQITDGHTLVSRKVIVK